MSAQDPADTNRDASDGYAISFRCSTRADGSHAMLLVLDGGKYEVSAKEARAIAVDLWKCAYEVDEANGVKAEVDS